MLRWQDQWGAHIKAWQKSFDEGHTPPRQFFERPEVEQDLVEEWLAFKDLTTERQIGMGVGPIPRSKIREYATDELGLIGDAHERFCLLIGMVDDDYVSMANTAKKPTGPQSAIPPDDVEGVKALFGRLEGRKKETMSKDRREV